MPGGAASRPASRRWLGPVLGLVVGLVLGLGGGLLVGPDAASDPAPDPLAERVEELQAEEAARDAEAVTALTEQTGEVLDLLAPVVEAGAEHPPGSAPPSAEDVAAWREAVEQAREGFGDSPSAGTGVNVARAGLVSALEAVDTMVGAFSLAGTSASPDGALSVAQQARRQAALSWSVGATQLDAVNVEAGNGHVHLFLPPVEGSGALTADPEEAGHPNEPGHEEEAGHTDD